MASVDEVLATMAEGDASTTNIDEVLVIDSNTRQISIPGSELILGVESDTHSERKYFQCPRHVGNGLDLASCFIRVNFRNANGDIDSYLVDDVVATGDTITFSWELSRKVTQYMGQVKFLVCCNRPGGNGVAPKEWHTTQATGMVLVGLEPDSAAVETASEDVITALLVKVEAQSANVEAVGASEVAKVTAEGATQVNAVKTASEAAETAAVAEIEAKGVNVRTSIPDDYTSLGNAVDGLVRSRAGAIVCEAAGSVVAVDDASDLPMQGLRVFGKTTQVTTTGAQLTPYPYFNGNKTYNGITWTINPDGSVKAKGTATATSPLYFTNSTHELAPGQYTVSGSDNGVTVRIDSTIQETGKWKAGVAISKNGQPVTFTVTEEDTATYFYTLYASVENGNTVDVTIYPMLNVGPSALPWEIYTGGKPSPSPDFPQELVSLEPTVRVCRKNLLPYPYHQSSAAGSGATFTAQADGGILGSGTATAATGITLYDGDVLGSGMVTASLSGSFTNMVWQIALYDVSGNELVTHQSVRKVTIDLDTYPTAKKMRMLVKRATNSEVSGVAYPQLEFGTVETEYEAPGTSQALSITHTLPGIPVTSGGNYTDSDGQQWVCDEVDLERGVYVQRFKVVTLTGDESWVQDTNYSCTYRVGAGHIAIGGMSTHYHTYVRTEDIGSVSGVYLAYTVNHIITDPRFVNNLAGFKAFLANEYSSGTPVIVIRRLAEPIETPLSETEIAAYRAMHTNYPNTTVLNDSGAHMVVKYAADTKLYIDNKIKEALQ